jgi:UDP-2-acetamido-3-amino-2,3-dideoxy-glucuronate N-acetyltransferase
MFIHPTAIVEEGAQVGSGCKIWHFSHVLPGAVIGENTSLGQNCVIMNKVVIGRGCKIQNNISLHTGVSLEDEVFIGPSAVFTNILVPRAHIIRRDAFVATRVRYRASIGANATIICGITIGTYALVGAGAVVTRDVSPHALVVGNPARQIAWVCDCACSLSEKLICASCGKAYVEEENGLKLKD